MPWSHVLLFHSLTPHYAYVLHLADPLSHVSLSLCLMSHCLSVFALLSFYLLAFCHILLTSLSHLCVCLTPSCCSLKFQCLSISSLAIPLPYVWLLFCLETCCFSVSHLTVTLCTMSHCHLVSLSLCFTFPCPSVSCLNMSSHEAFWTKIQFSRAQFCFFVTKYSL